VTIDDDVVRHIAALAELAVEEAEVSRLSAQLESIVQFVAQLQEIPSAAAAAGVVVGPTAVALRPDRIDPIPLGYPLARMAPEFEDGFFVVPRLGGMAES